MSQTIEILKKRKSRLMGTYLIGKYGEQYTQFYHKPKEAIKFLMKVKRGECVGALHRDDIGDIDIVWGEVTDKIKHKGKGLAHIIDKHKGNIEKLGFKVEDFIPIVVQYGDFKIEKSDAQKLVFESNKFRFVVAIEKIDNYNKKWLLTSFDLE